MVTEKENESVQVEQAAKLTIPARLYLTPIEQMELSNRVRNCLAAAGIANVGQVVEMDDGALLAIRNIGQVSLIEIRESLLRHGFLAEVEEAAEMVEGGADAAVEDELVEIGGAEEEGVEKGRKGKAKKQGGGKTEKRGGKGDGGKRGQKKTRKKGEGRRMAKDEGKKAKGKKKGKKAKGKKKGKKKGKGKK